MKLHLEVRDDNGHTVLAPDIIEIPDGIDGISLSGYGLECRQCTKQVPCLANIPIPKIRKWIYEFTLGGVTWRTTSPLSEEEYNQQHMTAHKIPETMIEVSE